MRTRSSISPRASVERRDAGFSAPGPWRSAADERRYLRSIQRYPDAAVFVAEDGERLVGRLSLSRDPHPASRHVADLGLMVAASHRRQGVGTALLDGAVGWARESGVRKLELHVFPWNEPALGALRVVRFRARGLSKAPLRARGRARRRHPDGVLRGGCARRLNGGVAPLGYWRARQAPCRPSARAPRSRAGRA